MEIPKTSPLLTVFVSVLSTFIIAAVFFKFFGPIPLSVTSTTVQKQSTFDVTGEGTATVIPDLAEVTLGVTLTRPTVSQAQKEANQIINNLTDALKKNGIEEKNITTQDYDIFPQTDYKDGGRKIIGYTITVNLHVKTPDFSRLETAIDAATALGANQVSGISFSLSDDKKDQAADQARRQAIDKAKQKAQSLAQAAGLKLGRIVNVQETPVGRPLPIYARAESKLAAPGQEPTQIEPGESQIRLSLTLSWETL